jgi:SAM-dependent methyltransferase
VTATTPALLTHTCRVCGQRLAGDPLLRFANMPGVAQFLPDTESLDRDVGVDLEVRQCSGCGLVQLPVPPVPYYRDVVRAAALSPEMGEFRLKQFGEFVRRFSLVGKKVFEIGAGRGEYLALMVQAGADAYGIEHAQASVESCTARGLNVSRGFIDHETDTIAGGPFDAFFILNFLEHHPDPVGTLKGMHRNLAPGGIGIVEVPNFDMMLRDKLFSEFTTDHLLYFTRDTLATTLRLSGFDVPEISEVWHEYILSAVVRKREQLDLSSLREQQARLETELRAYLQRFPRKLVAIWGAGHQALALMALMNLAGSIKYVVDSAPFKQGKYTPATHIPIVSPDTLRTDPVQAVIVMAASYSDEVARTLRTMFPSDLNVAIWRESGLESV